MIFDGPDIIFINEEFHAERVRPDQLDELLSGGWRHFGTHFFRYSLGIYEDDIRRVIPLRIRLRDFSLSKSQRKVLRRNSDLLTIVQPVAITPEVVDLFDRHRRRFKAGIPDSIYDFISGDSSVPCPALQVSVRNAADRLVAISYFDVGDRSISAIYAMFDPEFSARSLGIFTMLKEIEFALDGRKDFYYQGYSYEGESFYDYKKRFRGTECFDWRGQWSPLAGDEEIYRR
jgi:arginine-tRNA-protein transferase